MKYLKNRKCTIWSIAAVVVVAAIGMVFFMNEDVASSETKSAENTKKTKKVLKKGESFRAKGRKVRSRISTPGEFAVSGGRAALVAKPSFDYDEDDEARLSEEYRKLLSEIRKALDNDDKSALLRLVQKMQAKNNWASEVPFLVKSAMLDALGWFGSSCLPEVAGFLSDGNEEIAQSAIEKYEEALSDFDLSDRERSKLLVMAAQVITDSDAMDSMLFELNNMRNSVAIDTIKQLMASGGDATQALLPENIEFVTGEEGLDTPEKLDQWLTENPDDESDEEFYGGSSSDE